jgi:hypothetical protein
VPCLLSKSHGSMCQHSLEEMGLPKYSFKKNIIISVKEFKQEIFRYSIPSATGFPWWFHPAKRRVHPH